MKKSLCALLICIFVLAGSAFCLGPRIDKHTAVWDANTEGDLAGYYLYWRTSEQSFSDDRRVTVGVSPSPSFDLMTLNLPSGVYVIAVSAYNTAGNESGLSEEVTWNATIPDDPKNVGIE